MGYVSEVKKKKEKYCLGTQYVQGPRVNKIWAPSRMHCFERKFSSGRYFTQADTRVRRGKNGLQLSRDNLHVVSFSSSFFLRYLLCMNSFFSSSQKEVQFSSLRPSLNGIPFSHPQASRSSLDLPFLWKIFKTFWAEELCAIKGFL